MSFDTVQTGAEIVGECELYEVIFQEHTEYFTSAQKTVRFNSGAGANDYQPVPITRSGKEQKQDSGLSLIKITVPIRTGFTATLIAAGLGAVKIKIIRGFGLPNASSPYDWPHCMNPWFVGTVTMLHPGRSVVTADIESYSSIFAANVPRCVIQSQCNFRVFDSGCGLLKTGSLNGVPFSATGTVAGATAGQTVQISAASWNPMPPGGVFADVLGKGYFTGGKIRTATPSPATPYREIIRYDSASSTAYLHVPFPPLAAGTTVELLAGCDRAQTTCVVKFANQANNFGFPLTPKTDPVLSGF